MSLLATTVATGLAGFDPAPLLIAAAALASGARRRALVVFCAVLLGGTAAWGLVLTLLVGPPLSGIHWWHLARSGTIAAGIELAAGLGLLLAAALRGLRAHRRARRGDLARADHPGPGDTPGFTAARGAWIGLGFVAIVIGDPAFVVQVVAASHAPPSAAAGGWVLWALISQLPLTLLGPVLLLGRGARFARRFDPWVQRLRAAAAPVVTVALAGAGLLMLLDAGSELAVGTFLLR